MKLDAGYHFVYVHMHTYTHSTHTNNKIKLKLKKILARIFYKTESTSAKFVKPYRCQCRTLVAMSVVTGKKQAQKRTGQFVTEKE